MPRFLLCLSILVLAVAAIAQKTTPDRAFVYSSTNQSINSFARLNTPLAVLPGGYLVKGWRHAGDFDDVVVTVGTGETVQAELALRPK